MIIKSNKPGDFKDFCKSSVTDLIDLSKFINIVKECYSIKYINEKTNEEVLSYWKQINKNYNFKKEMKLLDNMQSIEPYIILRINYVSP